jgi:hypothetical protein
MPPQNTQRGIAREIHLYIDYPDGTSKVARLDGSSIAKLVFHDDEASTLAPDEWQTDQWENNPAFVIVRNDGSIVTDCRPVDHPPPPP